MLLENPDRDTSGWITDIPVEVRIDKERAVRMYLLDPTDLDGVRFNDRFYARTGRYFNEYQERDVEWRAWEKHGGPVGFWKFLKQQQERGALQSNLLPYGYRRGGRYDLSLPHPPELELQDRYVSHSATLREVKLTLAPWIWNACNVALDHVFLHIPLSPHDLTRDREFAMRLAVSFIRSHPCYYAERPAQPLGSSHSMTQLREVLSQAPIAPAPGSLQWAARVDGLVFDDEEDCYDWSPEYLERVFNAACGVIEELGTGDEGMRTARWEIYDKYSESPSFGLWYQPEARAWMDNAAVWLDGGLSGEELRGHLRSECPAGLAYNNLLQDNPMRSSVQLPSQTSTSLPPVPLTPGPSQ